MNPFKSLGAVSLRQLEKAVKEQKENDERRLVNMAVKDSASKDPAGYTMSIARHAGRIDAMDSLLVLIYDATRKD